MSKEANKLLSLINKYTYYCQKASANFYTNAPYANNRTEAIKTLKHWSVLKQEIQTLCKYKKDAEKRRAHIEQKWISVKDVMPEIGTEVIVYRPKFYTRPKLVTGHLIKSNNKLCWNNDCEDNYFELSDVSHWMPLFKFPEDEEEEGV